MTQVERVLICKGRGRDGDEDGMKEEEEEEEGEEEEEVRAELATQAIQTGEAGQVRKISGDVGQSREREGIWKGGVFLVVTTLQKYDAARAGVEGEGEGEGEGEERDGEEGRGWNVRPSLKWEWKAEGGCRWQHFQRMEMCR